MLCVVMDNVTCDQCRVMNRHTIQPGPPEGILVASVLLLFSVPTRLCSVRPCQRTLLFYNNTSFGSPDKHFPTAVILADAFMIYTLLTTMDRLRKFIYNLLYVFMIFFFTLNTLRMFLEIGSHPRRSVVQIVKEVGVVHFRWACLLRLFMKGLKSTMQLIKLRQRSSGLSIELQTFQT
jgi:hypothetical protein